MKQVLIALKDTLARAYWVPLKLRLLECRFIAVVSCNKDKKSYFNHCRVLSSSALLTPFLFLCKHVYHVCVPLFLHNAAICVKWQSPYHNQNKSNARLAETNDTHKAGWGFGRKPQIFRTFGRAAHQQETCGLIKMHPSQQHQQKSRDQPCSAAG